MKWLISFLTGSLCAAAIAMGLVLISPGDTDVFEPYRIGSGAFTVYERTVEKEPGPDGTEHTVATTSMRSGILVWSLTGGLGFIALKAMSKKGNRDNGQD